MIEAGCSRRGFPLAAYRSNHLVDPGPLYICICSFILFFTQRVYGRQAPLMLHWQCKHPEVHFGHHRDPAAAQRGHIVFLLLCCPWENPDVAPDCGPECPTAPPASRVKLVLHPRWPKKLNFSSEHLCTVLPTVGLGMAKMSAVALHKALHASQ